MQSMGRLMEEVSESYLFSFTEIRPLSSPGLLSRALNQASCGHSPLAASTKLTIETSALVTTELKKVQIGLVEIAAKVERLLGEMRPEEESL